MNHPFNREVPCCEEPEEAAVHQSVNVSAPASQPSAEEPLDYWRCFHCDFATSNREEAQAHFGDRDDAEEFKPICKWWATIAEDERAATLQDYLQQLNYERMENYKLEKKLEAALSQPVVTQSNTKLTYEQEVHALLYKGITFGEDLIRYFQAQAKQESGAARRLTDKCIESVRHDVERFRALIPEALRRREAPAPSPLDLAVGKRELRLMAQMRTDIGNLLAELDAYQKTTGEFLEDDDAAIVEDIRKRNLSSGEADNAQD